MKRKQAGQSAVHIRQASILRGILSCLSILILGSVSIAQSGNQKPSQDFATLDHFAIGATGVAGVVSPGEKQLWTLIQTKDKKRLVAMTNDKNAITRLYGVLGLRYLNAPEYKPVLGELKQSKSEIKTLSGCIGGMDRVASIAERIEKGGYDKQLKYDMEHRRKP